MSKFDNTRVQGCLHADGQRLVNGAGEEIILRGWGAGNWTNPEGFMLGIGTGYMGASMNPGLSLPGRFTSGRTMNSVIRELCGTEYARKFWPRWHLNHLGEADIRAMAELGFNSVRLPLTAWVLLEEEPGIVFNEEGFAMLDKVLDWCEQYKIYAILDLHGAPGGQSGLACDDGLDNIPHMFLEPETRERALILWEELARRYRDRWIVGGYELLNEPISPPRWHYLMGELERFYDDAIARIRRIDRQHLIILEGATFCTNMHIFHRSYDPDCRNWAISVHLYGFSPERRDLYKFLEVQQRLNVPLWLGEGRSRNPDMAIFYEIAAAHHIGFNLWVWKSVVNDEDSGAAAYDLPAGFDAVLKYATEGGARPSYAEAQALFDALLENIRYENCHVNMDAHRYCRRAPGITLPAVGYDPTPGEGFSGGWLLGNPLAYRTEDGTHLVLKDGVQVTDAIPLPGAPQAKTNPMDALLLQLDEGAFARYTVHDVKTACPVTFTARALNGGRLAVSDGVRTVELDIPAGAALAPYAALTLEPGEARAVQIRCVAGSVQLDSIMFAEG